EARDDGATKDSASSLAPMRSPPRERLLDHRRIDEPCELLPRTRLAISLLRDPDLLGLEHVEHVGHDPYRELHLRPAVRDLRFRVTDHAADLGPVGFRILLERRRRI